MRWIPYEENKKWAVVINPFRSDSGDKLDISIGDDVFILRHCDEWFYGFKMNASSKSGVFPKACVTFKREELSDGVSAELQMMAEKLVSMFVSGKYGRMNKHCMALSGVVDLKYALSERITKYDIISSLKKLHMHMSMVQSKLFLPFIIRDENFRYINPFSVSPIDLHWKHKKLIRDLEDSELSAQCPAYHPFNLRIRFKNLPEAFLTMYLVSQVLQSPNNLVSSPANLVPNVDMNFSGSSNSTGTNFTPFSSSQDTHDSHTGVNMKNISVSELQPTSLLMRLTEDVTLDGNAKDSYEVIFTNLDPFKYQEKRILLLVTLTRIGSMHLKRAKSGGKTSAGCSSGNDKSQQPNSMLKRPIGVACLDITSSIVPYFNRSSFDWELCKPAKDETSPLDPKRIVNFKLTGEQFLSEALLRAIGDTQVLSWSSPNSGYPDTDLTTILNIPSISLDSSEVPKLEVHEITVLSPTEAQPFNRDTLFVRRYASPYFNHTVVNGVTQPRRELYVTLVSGNFSKGNKTREHNIEVEVSVIDSNGNWLNLNNSPERLSPVHKSVVYYHKNQPYWSELFSITLPYSPIESSCTISDNVGDNVGGNSSEIFDHETQQKQQQIFSPNPTYPGMLAGVHLRFLCRHRSTGPGDSEGKILGVAYLRLQPSTSVPVLLPDGDYHLYIHKMDMAQVNACRYLCQPFYCEDDSPILYGSSSGSGSGSIGSTVSSGSLNSSGWSNVLSIPNFSTSSSSRNRMDTLHVQTLVCSSYHTTDENLTKVILWRNYQEDIIMCLRQGIYLSRKDNELRKFTRSLIDSMLQLLLTTMDENFQHIINLNLGYSLLMGLARCYKDLAIDSVRQHLIHSYLNGSGFVYYKIYIPYLQLLNAMLFEIISPVLYQNHPYPPSAPLPPLPVSSNTVSRSKLDQTLNSRNGGPTNYSSIQFFDSKAVQLIFSTIQWAFLIIVRSRHLDIMQLNDKYQKETESLFIRQVESFLSRVIDVTCRTDDVLLRLIIFKHVPEIIKSLTEVYPKLKLAQFIVRLITRTLESTELPSQKILTETIHSSLFCDPQCRYLLVPTIQTSLTHVFTEKLDKVLNSKSNENTAIMDVWCDVLLSFVDSFTKATTTDIISMSSTNHNTNSVSADNFDEEGDEDDDDENGESTSRISLTPTRKSSSTIVPNSPHCDVKSDEIFCLLIKRNFIRWTMQQLARILIFIHQRNSTLLCCNSFPVVGSDASSRSSSNNSSYCSRSDSGISGSTTSPSPNKLLLLKPPIHPSYYRLQPIMGCLSTVLFSLLRMLTKSSWMEFLQSVYQSEEESCQCTYCHNLQLVDIYDFLHELFNIFCLMHLYPAYPSPMFQSRSDRIWAVGRYSWDDGVYDDRRSENYDQKVTLSLSSSLPSPHQSTSSNISSVSHRHTTVSAGNHQNNAELFSQSWIEMLALISNSELDVIEVLIELAIKPFFVDSKVDNKFLLPSTQSSITTVICQAEQRLTTDLIELLAHCLTGFAVEQAHLCVEAMPPVTRTRIDQSITNQRHHSIDMRQRACNLLLSLWYSIDDRSKMNYIQIFLPNVINMATLPLPQIREMCVDCILNALTIHSPTVEHVFVSEIDRVVQWAGTDFAADIRDLLQSRLLNSQNALPTTPRRTTSTEDVHMDHRQRVIYDFSKQIDCLLHYGKFIDHPSQMNEMLAFCNLRKFYESINRKDMILRYLYRLDRLHAAYSNKTERGYTLELISENYSWDENSVDISDVSPHYVQYGQNSSRELRERLLMDSFEYLKQGTDWEHAIEISNKLVHLYRDIMPNYERLSEILKEQADLYKNIVTNERSRIPFRYYLIEFYGPASSLITANRKLIYRTTSDLGDVLNMLTEQFPDATLLNQPLTSQSSTLTDKFCIFASGNLEPEPAIPEHLDSRVVDNKIKSYYSKNRVKCFLRHRPLQPTEKKDGRLVTNTEETRYCITETMPNIIPIMPVDRVEIRMLSQTEWANKQIQGIIKVLHTDLVSARSQEANISQYIGKLVSSIQSPVSGGVPKLVKDVELSDDPRQEKCFSQLADSVLELLELQLAFLKLWYTIDPPPPPVSHRLFAMRNPDISENTSGSTGSGSSGTVGSGNYLLHEMIGSYEVLVRDMSRKFGFSVDHLNADNLRYGPISTDRQANTNLSNVNNTNILSPLRRNSRSSQNNLNTGVATIAQSTVPRVFFKPDYSGSEHATIRSLQRSFQMAGSGRAPLESVTFSLPTNKSNSSFNVLSADPPPLPDRPLLTRPAVQTMNTSGSGGGTRPTTLSTHNTSDNSSGNLLVSGGISNHDDLGTARGRTITPDDDAHTHNINSSINKEKKQLTSPSITSRFESSPNVIRSRTRPLPPLPPTPVRSSSITRTENLTTANTQSKQVGNSTSSNLNNGHVTNSESAPPLPERKSKASCPPAISTGCRSQNDPSSDFP